MVYDEYSSLASRHKVQVSASGANATGGVKLWGREVALTAWEGLAASELILPAAGSGGIRAMDGGKAGKMWKVDVGLEEIPGSVDLNAVMAKWCREI
jgi:origin recognition complex subunit 4